jgi:hypothetical protein
MAEPRRPSRRGLLRSELPDTFTPDTVRDLDIRRVRQLSRPGNGVLSPEEQQEFDAALRDVMQEQSGRLAHSLRRFDPDRAAGFDPELRRSYLRTQARLAQQAERARRAFPELATELEDAAPPTALETPTEEEPDEISDAKDDDTLAELESDIEEASDLLVLLERIASIEQEQLEHHKAQELRDVRSVFFALVVSVAVIIAGVSPLVDADPSQRLYILGWTAAVCVTAGVVYAIVRAVQLRGDEADTEADAG